MKPKEEFTGWQRHHTPSSAPKPTIKWQPHAALQYQLCQLHQAHRRKATQSRCNWVCRTHRQGTSTLLFQLATEIRRCTQTAVSMSLLFSLAPTHHVPRSKAKTLSLNHVDVPHSQHSPSQHVPFYLLRSG